MVTSTKVFVRSFGCSANTADSEVLAGCLSKAGYTTAESEVDAELVVYNTCAVKGPTENRIIDALKRVPKNKKVIVAGCLPAISFERMLREVRFDAAVGPAAGEGIAKVVGRVLAGEKVVELDPAAASMPRLDLPRLQSSPVISVVPVNYGCLGSCAYCCVVHARGHLRSHEIDEVVERVKCDAASGLQEFWITSQDVACYGREIGTNLAELLRALVAIEGDFRVRVGMMTPSFMAPFLGDLVDVFRSEKVFKFVHLPVQSGDDGVLRTMRRFYTANEFKDIVDAFRNAFPEITLSTDVICGFPGETTHAFENTLNLIRDVKPDIVNVSKFFARPRTVAWTMRDMAVEKEEIKRRSAQAAALAKQVSLERNRGWMAWSGEILVDEKGKSEGSWIGRNFAYKPIVVRSSENLIGKKIKVTVARAFPTYLSAVVVN